MKIFKHIETGHVVEEANPNHYSIYSRFGYEEIKEKPVEKTIEELAAEYADKAVIGKCNVDDCDELPMKYGIRSIPTLLFFKNGELVDRHVGVASKADLAAKIDALL